MTEHHDTGTGWPGERSAAPNPDREDIDNVADVDVDRDEAELDADEFDAEDREPDGREPDGREPDLAAGVALAGRRRVSAAGAAIGVLLVLLGFAFVVQLRSNATDPKLASARPEDLVRILSDLDAQKDRLSQEIGQLQNTQQQLAAGSQGRAAALDAAAKRARDLGILAGTLPAQGPGIQVQFRAAGQDIKAGAMLDAVEELRDAGAEAMQLDGANGVSVRIVASSWFLDGPKGALTVDGRTLTGPYALTAIGDPQTMQNALNIPGGVLDTVHNAGGTVIVNQPGTVRVTALHQTEAPRYARPAS